MKQTFNNLSDEKKQRIIKSCIKEFGEHGYDSSSVNRIIKQAGISKGGLYEYISSKEELFAFTVDYAYSSLYNYLKKRIKSENISSSEQLITRLKLISDFSIDFYICHPEFVYLIVRTSNMANCKVPESIQEIFSIRFLEFFKKTDTSELKFPKEQILELAMWLFLKTQFDFLKKFKKNIDPAELKKDYINTWQFYLTMMKSGLYNKIN